MTFILRTYSSCSFSNFVSYPGALTWCDAHHLTPCHRGLVSYSCHFFSLAWRRARKPDALAYQSASHRPVGRLHFVTVMTHRPPPRGDKVMCINRIRLLSTSRHQTGSSVSRLRPHRGGRCRAHMTARAPATLDGLLEESVNCSSAWNAPATDRQRGRAHDSRLIHDVETRNIKQPKHFELSPAHPATVALAEEGHRVTKS